MVNSLKKAFSTFVSLTTILWSVGAGALAFPNAASAATLSAGDLVKASGPALYYYAADGKRYVFPNEKTYFSWFTNFSSVKTITDAELSALAIGGNVTMRPGTKLVKIQTDPKTYAVSLGGVLHWIQSEAIAKALYGDAWNTKIIDVPDSFFVNYTVGSSVATNVHPDGTLIQYAGDPTRYVVWGGVKRKIVSDAVFAANGFNAAFVETTTLTYGNGSDVTGREGVLADVVYVAGAGVTGALTVALASDTPAGMNVPRNASSVPLVKVNFTAGSSDVMVTGLRFHRVGIGAVADFSNVYLYDGSGKRLTTGRSINTTTNLVEFNSLSVTVAAGTTWSALVYGDFSGSSATVGGQHAFELADAASVVVSGSATVGGAFPVRGNVFTVGSTSSARVDIQKGTQPANPTIGSKDAEVSNIKITANTNDVALKQITLYQAGSVTNSDLTNFKLYQGSTVVATAASVASDGHVVLTFSTPFVVANGTTKVFSLHADVGGRAGRTIRTYVEYTTDVTAIDKVYNAGAAICINTSGACSGSPANMDGTGGSGDSPQTNGNFIEVLTQGGQLTNAFNGPATGNVAKGQLGVSFYKFALTSPDNTLEIRKIVFTIAKTSGSASTCKVIGSSGTKYFRSVKIKNMDTGATVMGPQEMSGSNGDTTNTLTYTDSFNINQGQTLNLALVADLSNSQDSGDTFIDGACAYQATFTAFGSSDVRVVATGEFLSTSKIIPNTNVTGNAQTVKSSGLDISLASNPVSGTLVKKQADVAVAGFVLTAAAQSDITVTSLTLGGQANLATSGCNSNAFGGAACNLSNFSTRVTSLALYRADTGAQVGLAKAPDTTSGKAQISNMNLVIAKGTSLTLLAKATFGSTASTTAPYDKVAVGIAQASDVQVQDQDANTVTPTLSSSVTAQATGASPSVVQTILNSGTITVQADAHPVANIVIAGKDAWVPLAQYKATAQYEALNIDRIAVLASSTGGIIATLTTPTTSGTADNADFSAVAIASGGAVKGQDVLPSGASGTKDVDLSTSPIVVPKDGSVQFQIWAKLASVSASSTVSGATSGAARSGHAPAVGLNNNLQSGEWDSNYASKLNIRTTGAASGERVYAATGATHGNAMALRKTQPIVTKQSLSSTTLANIDQDLIKFQVAADSAGSIAWKQVALSFSKTSAISLSNFRLRKGATDMDTAVYAVTAATSTATAVDLVSGTINAGVNSGTIVVSFKPGQEESISGSGSVYTVHATVAGAVAGQNVSLSFIRDASTTSIVTGYLTNAQISTIAANTSTNIFNIDTSVTGGATSPANFAGTFVWSDNSEVPHSSALGSAGGSRDWINDLYVQDLSQSQTLSL